MMDDFTLFSILMLINFIIVIVYVLLIFLLKKEKSFAVVVKVVVMFLCPIIGPLFIFIGYISYKVFSHAVDLEDVIFSKERTKVYMHADEDRGRSMVSVEEALAVTDKINLRKLMLNVVRGNVKKSLSSISLALNGEDSETSHYAASVLQDELNDFRAHVQKEYRELSAICETMKEQEEEFSVTRFMDLFHFMDDMLEQQVFTEMEQKSMVAMMNDVGEMIYNNASDVMSCHDFEAICLRLLDVKDYDNCRVWCDRAKTTYPATLQTYTASMKLCYYTGDREKFFELLDELKKSNIIIDKQTLEMIRIFS